MKDIEASFKEAQEEIEKEIERAIKQFESELRSIAIVSYLHGIIIGGKIEGIDKISGKYYDILNKNEKI